MGSFVTDSGATSVTFQSANKPTTPAAKFPSNALKLPNQECNAAKSGYLTSGSGSFADLAACAQSCHKSAQCNGVTFYVSSGWCSHFSTCEHRGANSWGPSVIFHRQINRRPPLPNFLRMQSSLV